MPGFFLRHSVYQEVQCTIHLAPGACLPLVTFRVHGQNLKMVINMRLFMFTLHGMTSVTLSSIAAYKYTVSGKKEATVFSA